MAQRRADELQARMQKRLAELEAEKLISAAPPVVTGGAIVFPRGLVDRVIGGEKPVSVDPGARREIELAAMRAVIRIETALGYEPRDVSASKIGYDIEDPRNASRARRRDASVYRGQRPGEGRRYRYGQQE